MCFPATDMKTHQTVKKSSGDGLPSGIAPKTLSTWQFFVTFLGWFFHDLLERSVKTSSNWKIKLGHIEHPLDGTLIIPNHPKPIQVWPPLLLMAKILHQFIGTLSHYLYIGFHTSQVVIARFQPSTVSPPPPVVSVIRKPQADWIWWIWCPRPKAMEIFCFVWLKPLWSYPPPGVCFFVEDWECFNCWLIYLLQRT